jgi:hypothetical protein
MVTHTFEKYCHIIGGARKEVLEPMTQIIEQDGYGIINWK